jgi:hypothetical protein
MSGNGIFRQGPPQPSHTLRIHKLAATVTVSTDHLIHFWRWTPSLACLATEQTSQTALRPSPCQTRQSQEPGARPQHRSATLWAYNSTLRRMLNLIRQHLPVNLRKFKSRPSPRRQILTSCSRTVAAETRAPKSLSIAMSGTGIVSLISGVLSIIEATKNLYDNTTDVGQPEAFRQVAARLPLAIAILHSAEERASKLDETALKASEYTLQSCKEKAEKLYEIFQKVVRKDNDKWYDRYKKALGTLGKSDKVEYLMEGILKDIQLLVYERLIGIATEAQTYEITQAIKQMNEIPSSLQDETRSVIETHQGSSNNNDNTAKKSSLCLLSLGESNVHCREFKSVDIVDI